MCSRRMPLFLALIVSTILLVGLGGWGSLEPLAAVSAQLSSHAADRLAVIPGTGDTPDSTQASISGPGEATSAALGAGRLAINLPYTVTLTITVNSPNIDLNWSAVPTAAGYDLHRSSTPFFSPSPATLLATLPPGSTSYSDPNTTGDPNTNYFYLLQALDNNGDLLASSNQVGEIDYPLNNNGGQYSLIALPFPNPSLTDAASLAAYIGSVEVALKWNPTTQTFRFFVPPATGDNFSLSQGDAVFISVSPAGPAVVTMAGPVTAVQHQLGPGGFNFISLPLQRFDLVNAAGVAADVTNVGAMLGWNEVTQAFRFFVPPATGDNFLLRPGRPFALELGAAGPTAWPAITISAFSPDSGLVGTTVSLTGTNFIGASEVAFNDTAALSYTVDSLTQLRAEVPTGATSGPIRVTNPGGSGLSPADFTVLTPPIISGFNPPSGPVGTEVTITGSNFISVTGVAFNGFPAQTFTIDSDSQLRAIVPSGATSGPISLTNPSREGVSIDDFIVITVPIITSFSPTSGPIGTEVTITGSNFISVTEVAFSGSSAISFTVDSDTQLRAEVPYGAINGPISVTNLEGNGTSTSVFVVTTPTSSVCGTISQDSTWLTGYIYQITCNVTIADGTTLTIEPGAIIEEVSTSRYGLYIDGALLAQGTPQAPIVFTSGDDNPGPADWQGIWLRGSSGSVLDNVIVEYAGYNFSYNSGTYYGGLFITDGSPTIRNSVFRFNGQRGVTIINGSPTLLNNEMHNNSSGIWMQNANPTITAGSIHNNSSYAMQTILPSQPIISGTSVYSNTYDTQLLAGTHTYTQSYTWNNWGVAYRFNGNLTVAEGVTLTVEAGVIVEEGYTSSPGQGLYIDGALLAQGTPQAPIVFTSGDDNPGPADWQGIWLRGSSGSVLDNVIVEYAGYNFSYNSGTYYGGLFITDGSPTIRNSVFRFNGQRGVTIINGSPTLLNNEMHNNSSGIWMQNANPTITAGSIHNNSSYAMQTILPSQPIISGTSVYSNTYDTQLLAGTHTYTQSYTWNNWGVAYRFNGNLTVAEGVTLTVEAGVIVEEGYTSSPGQGLYIDGALLAQGTPQAPIVFTSGDDNPGPADWQGIWLRGSSGSVLDNVIVEYAGYNFSYNSGTYYGGLFITDGSPTIRNSVFRFNGQRGVTIINGSPTLLNNEMHNNSSGIWMQNANPTITAGSIHNNSSYAMQTILPSQPIISGTSVYSNTYDTQLLAGTHTYTQSYTWNNWGVAYRFNGNLTVAEGVTLTVEAGVIVEEGYTSSPGQGLYIDGALLAQGTPQAPIVFTSGDDNPGPADWQGIWLRGSSGSVLDNVIVEYAGYNFSYNSGTYYGGLFITDGSPTIRNSVFRFNGQRGVTIINGSPTLLNNEMHNNSSGIWMQNANPTITAGSIHNNSSYAMQTILPSQPIISGTSVYSNTYDTQLLAGTHTYTQSYTWNNWGVAYRFNGNLTVAEGVTLTVEAGVIVEEGYTSSPGQGLYIDGALLAQGTPQAPIVFTSGDDNPGPADWQGIWLRGSSGSVLDNVIVEYAGYNFSYNSGTYYGGLFITDGSPTIRNSVFRFNGQRGVTIINGSPTLLNNEMHNNSSGIWMQNANPTITAGSIHNNSSYAMQTILPSQPIISGTSVYSNTYDTQLLAGTHTYTQSYTWNNWGVAYRFNGNLTVAEGVTLTVEAGVIVEEGYTSSPGQGLYIDGALLAQGTPQAPIVFTSGDDNPGPADWQGIWLRGSSGSVLDNVIVEYAGYNFSYNSGTYYGGLFITDGSPTIRNSVFRFNGQRGVTIINGSPTLLNNEMHNNSSGIWMQNANPTIRYNLIQ